MFLTRSCALKAPATNRCTAVLRAAVRAFVAVATAAIMGQASALAAEPQIPSAAPSKEILETVFPGATVLGPRVGNPPAHAVYRDGVAVGFVFYSRDVIGSIGYAGDSLNIAVGLDRAGIVTGAQLVEHKEPILIIGIRSEELETFVSHHKGINLSELLRVEAVKQPPPGMPDGIHGATVSSLLIRDAIIQSALAVARSRGILAGQKTGGGRIDLDSFEPRDWSRMLTEGAVTRLRLDGRGVAAGLNRPGSAAAKLPIGNDDLFIDLYAALVTPAAIGRNVLGDSRFSQMRKALPAGGSALLIAANGLYSFKGTGFVRRGVFDRIQIVQDKTTIRIKAEWHQRIEKLTGGMPEFREIGLFMLPAESGFDPARPWRAELLIRMERTDGSYGFMRAALGYALPEKLLRDVASGAAQSVFGGASGRLWQDVWWSRTVSIGVVVTGLIVLLAILVFHDEIARRPRLCKGLRNGFLIFTLFWLGWYAAAQLSVINVLTFVRAFLTGFRWDMFLLEPIVFVLWSFVAVTILFWARGVFCGWLCPFGALQELLHKVGRRLRIPTITVPFVLHERLWALKYVLFLIILALSLSFTELAITVAEAEPFKTAIVLNFQRSWPFVVYALGWLTAGLFVERAFCRYLCPLGAGLAIPARMRMFEWLKRRRECGSECHLCASACPVQAIHADGHINPNECIYCLNCQALYYDDQTCPPLVKRRLRAEELRADRRRLEEIRAQRAAAKNESGAAP